MKKKKIFLYSGMQKLIEKSGVGRAVYHQKTALEMNGLECINHLEGADIVHINTIFPKSRYIAYKARKHNIPVVYHAHSTKEDFRNSYIGSNIFDTLFGVWIKYCYNSGDIIVTPTNYSKKLLEAYGIKKRIQVISNGIDLNYYQNDTLEKGKFREKYGYCKNDKIIMSVGLWIERKGILDFVELAKRMPEYQFIWFGESDLRTVPKKIREAVHTQRSNLKFAGYVSREELKQAYNSCNLFLFPTTEETEGIVVLEAMAMKIPILIRDIPVYEDWLTHKGQVYKARNLEEFRQYTVDILTGNAKDLTDNAYQTARERDICQIGKELKNLYESIDNPSKKH